MYLQYLQITKLIVEGSTIRLAILALTNMDGQVTVDLTINPGARLLAIVEKGRRAKWWKSKGSKSRGFKYFDAIGKQIKDETTLERIRLLVIPPAWKFVRI